MLAPQFDFETFADHEHQVVIDGEEFIMKRKSNQPRSIKSAVRNYDAIVQLLHMSCNTLRAEGVSDAFKEDLANRIEELTKTLQEG